MLSTKTISLLSIFLVSPYLAWASAFSTSTINLKSDNLFSYRLTNKNFSGNNRKIIEHFFNEVQNALPQKIKQTLAFPIDVTFAKVTTKAFSAPECDFSKFLKTSSELESGTVEIPKNEKSSLAKASLLGGYFNPKIHINDNLVNQILLGPDRSVQFTCMHQNGYKTAMASLIHETVRLYDSQKKVRISDSSYFQTLAGWVLSGFIIPKRKAYNHDLQGTPDPYEHKSPQEKLAVNMEYFLLDPQFRCQKPAMFGFLSNYFSYTPTHTQSCTMNYEVKPKQSVNSSSLSRVINIDPKKLYQIHYLIAGKGEAMMSRWGHAMFHLLYCPDNSNKESNCLNDRQNHIVVSFRANIMESEMSQIKGLTGQYTSEMIYIPLEKVIEEYTKGEFRDMKSIPLRLTEEEKNRFVQRMMELDTSYTGKYYFLSNNCASEALNLLKVTLPNNNQIQRMTVSSPIDLQEKLQKVGLSDESIFSDLKKAKNSNHYFYSYAEVFEKDNYVSLINKKIIPKNKYNSFTDYLKSSTPPERLSYLEKIMRSDPSTKNSSLGQFILIERLIRTHYTHLYTNWTLAMKEKKEGPFAQKEIQQAAKELDNDYNRMMLSKQKAIIQEDEEKKTEQIQDIIILYVEENLPSIYRKLLASRSLNFVAQIYQLLNAHPEAEYDQSIVDTYTHFIQNYETADKTPLELTQKYIKEQNKDKQ